MRGVIRLIHPAPATAVIGLSLVLGAILADQAGMAPDARLALTVLAVTGSQIFTGALNDWADRLRDAVAQPDKPIPSGEVTPGAALGVAAAGLGVQVAASAWLGPLPLALGLVASASAAAYDLWLSRTALSVVPYLVSFGVLPLWVASGVGVPLERVAATPLLVAPFAGAAHLANALRDFDADRALGVGNLAQRLGRRASFVLAWGATMLVGLAVGGAMLADGRLGTSALLLGVIGLAAVAQGLAGPRRLWAGMLVAAVCWPAAWALGTG